MDGNTTITSGQSLFFVPMGQFPLYVLMSQAASTIVLLLIWAVCMRSLKMFGKGAVESVRSIPHSRRVGMNI
jgi:hypothetical protein